MRKLKILSHIPQKWIKLGRAFTALIISSIALTSYASIEDDVVEQVEGARKIKAYKGRNEGTWLPVPIPVANPTIGAGLQAALLYLHPQTSSNPDVPNATSGIVGMYTDTDSWFAGGFHDGNLQDDRYRFRVLAGTGEFNLDFFGLGSDSSLRDNPVPYTITSDSLFSQMMRRIPGTEDWYLGLRYMYIRSNVVFNTGGSNPGLPPISDDMTTSSLGLMANYDSRDDNYYPTSGSYFEMVWMRDSDNWGSDFEFDRLTSFYNYYYSFSEKDVVALRTHVANAHGDVPFYMLPTLRLRGFPAGQYRDNTSLSAHLEWRRKFLPRWGYILFYEAGSVADSLDRIFQTNTITAYGGGVRWQVTEDKLLNLGVDVGFSEDDYAVYVSVGEKF
ncbi:MAG: hypothetical protein AMJ55_09910 [Gammaproteobacteria bacterium SG8_15]|nr:MAG: hypothetical protein AMJ55_09910 [Gammaproteobacteria bacterium SG8_15]